MRIRKGLYVLLVCFAASVAAQADSKGVKLLSRADQLAWRGNWPKAGPLYAQAEEEFNQVGDSKNALKATLGRIRSRMQNAPSTTLTEELDRELTNPVLDTDPQLKIRAMAYKGDIAHQCDLWAAREAWEEVLSLSKASGDKAWEGRALGELGVQTVTALFSNRGLCDL